MTVVLALDEGTTSARALVVDDEGSVIATAQREIALSHPQPGWVEQDALGIASTQVALAREVLTSARLAPRDVAAIGIANQRETTVVWERASGKPIHPAIVWQDRRTADVCEELRARGTEPLVQRRTGLLLDPYFSATKLAWILDRVPGARASAERGALAFGTVDSWLVWTLTNGARHVTDASNASRTMLFDLERGDWDGEMLELLRVPRAVLPEVVATSGVAGVCDADGLHGIPIGAIAGDQQAALFGQRCTSPGLAKNTYGTGCFLLQNTGAERVASHNRLLSTIAWRIGDATTFALEGSVFVGGAVVQWLRDGLGLIRTSAEIEPLAASVADSGGVVLVPAFAGLGAPHWDPRARGALLGLTRGTTRAHVARAALESIALQVVDLAEALRADTGDPLLELRVDGGASRNDLLMQMQADFLQAPVVRAANSETTALGAAYLAGLACGVWKDLDAIDARRRDDRTFDPRLSRDEAATKRAHWNEAVERAKGWA